MTVELKGAAHRIFILQIPISARDTHQALYLKTLFHSSTRSPAFFATIMNSMEVALFGEWEWMRETWREVLVREQAERGRGGAGSGLSCSTEVWRAFACGCGEVDDEDGLDQESILRAVAAPLARAGISILYQSSSADDYLLVRVRDLDALREIAENKGWVLDWEAMHADDVAYSKTCAEAEREIEDAMQDAVPGEAVAGDQAAAAIIAPIPALTDTAPATTLEVSVDSGLGLSLVPSRIEEDSSAPTLRWPSTNRDKPRPDSGVLAPTLQMFAGGYFDSGTGTPDMLSPVSPGDMTAVLPPLSTGSLAHRPAALDLRPQLPTSHLLLPSTPSHSPKTAGISVTSSPIAMVGLRPEHAQEWWMSVFGLLAWPYEAKRWANLRGQGIQEVPPLARNAPPMQHLSRPGLVQPPQAPPAPFISYVRSPDGGSLATEVQLLRPLFLRDSDGFLQCTSGLLSVFDDDQEVAVVPPSVQLAQNSALLLSESVPVHLPSAGGGSFRQPSPERGRTRTRRRDIKSWPEPSLPSSLETMTNTTSIRDVPWTEVEDAISPMSSPPALPLSHLAPLRPPLGSATSSQSLPAMSVQRGGPVPSAQDADGAAQQAARRDIKRCLQLDMRVVDAESDTGAYHLDKSGLVMSFSNKLHRGGLRMLYASTFHTANILVEARSVEKARRLLEAR